MTQQQRDMLDTIYQWMDTNGADNMANILENIIDDLRFEIEDLKREVKDLKTILEEKQ